MLFNSFDFLLFFPIVTFLFFALPHKFRWLLLLIASCVFYMYFIPKYILILAVTIVVDYFAGIYIDKSEGYRRKLLLITSIIANVGFLAFFKYFNFISDNINNLAHFVGWNYSLESLNIILPVGLSFHTFQAMSYTIEVYRGNQKAEKHFGIYALYVMFYPQLVAGPIERPQNLLFQFRQKHYFEYQRVTDGLKLILFGLFKKMVIADRLAPYVNEVYNNPSNYSGYPVILATIMFAIQIFCDFSGYSDIAIGSARVMGFKLMENFKTPYFSKTIKEFWSRWHISLSTWFRDYLYISLGGNRVKNWRWQLNLFIVFLISGLWHGANWTFVIWGALHGTYLIVSIWFSRFKNKFNHILKIKTNSFLVKIFDITVVFILTSFAWIFFRANNLNDSITIINNMFVFTNSFSSIDILNDLTTLKTTFTLIILMELIHFLQRNSSILSLINSRHFAVRWAVYTIFLWIILVFGQFGNQQFIYFQF